MTQQPFGFLNALKPPGPSSAAFGNWIKRLANGAAVGHWGTLDPSACGVLVLAVGAATRLIPLLGEGRKQYVFELVVGERTDTGDSTGQVLETSPVRSDWKFGLGDAAASLTGKISQTPPMFSAVKVSGRPLYRSARLGATIPRAPRATTLYDLRVLDGLTPHDRARLFVECDAGTYVRVLCEDLGCKLGVAARMGALLRVASGPFALRDSVEPLRVASDLPGSLIDPLSVLTQPHVELDSARARRFMAGNEVSFDPATTSAEARQVQVDMLVTERGVLIGVGQTFMRDGTLVLAPTRVLVSR